MEPADVDPQAFVEYRLVRAADLLRRRFEDALRPHGLTPTQFSVLAVLRARPDATSAELARAVLVAPQSMAALIGRLEETGLVEPRQRRGRGVPAPTRLSARGVDVLAAAGAAVLALDATTRDVLGPHLRPLLGALERLEEHLLP